jgi:hypothetical protein
MMTKRINFNFCGILKHPASNAKQQISRFIISNNEHKSDLIFNFKNYNYENAGNNNPTNGRNRLRKKE